jgi:hypothetical protein
MQINVNNNNIGYVDNAGNVSNDKPLLSQNNEFKAQVINNSDGKAQIRLANGQVIEASLDSDVNLNIGDILNLKVNSTGIDRIELKILGKADPMEGLDLKNINMKELASLKDIKVASDVNSLKTLIENNIPVTADKLKLVDSLMNMFKGAKLNDIAFLLSQDIDVNEDNINILKDIHDNKVAFAKDIDKLKQNISEIIKEQPNIKEDLDGISEKYMNTDIKTAIDKILINAGKSNGEDIKNAQQNIEKLLNSLNDAGKLISNENIPSSLKEGFSSVVNQISKQVEFLDKVNQNYFHMFIPVNNNGDLKTAQFLIKDKENLKKRDAQKALNIFFALDTQNMGTVKIMMGYLNKNLSLEFNLRDANTINSMKQKKQELLDELKGLSFNVANIKFDIDKSAGIPLEHKQEETQQKQISKSHFDFKI